jgi:hypothetical protein
MDPVLFGDAFHPIRSASELRAWVRRIVTAEGSGELKQVDGNCRTRDFTDAGFPGDLIEMLFIAEADQRHWCLSCNTRSGGGAWALVQSPEDLVGIRQNIQFLGSVFP